MNFNPYNFIFNLPYLFKGMLVIIIVMALLIIITALLNKLTGRK